MLYLLAGVLFRVKGDFMKTNVPWKYVGEYFPLQVSQLPKTNSMTVNRFAYWVNDAYFRTSIACHYYNMWVMGEISLQLWRTWTELAIMQFAKREARELLK